MFRFLLQKLTLRSDMYAELGKDMDKIITICVILQLKRHEKFSFTNK